MTLRVERWVECDRCKARVPGAGPTVLDRAGWVTKRVRKVVRHYCPDCQPPAQPNLLASIEQTR